MLGSQFEVLGNWLLGQKTNTTFKKIVDVFEYNSITRQKILQKCHINGGICFIFPLFYRVKYVASIAIV
jgi:hypothetical protein